MPSYVLCARNITHDDKDGIPRFGGKVGDPSYLCVPWDPDAGDIPNQEPLPSHRLGDVRQWMDAIVRESASIEPVGQVRDIILFVHGYNTSPEEALKRQRLVETELKARGFPCMVIGFDWPTQGNSAAYLYDREEGGQAALFLVTGAIFPFALYASPECRLQVHVLAHSMGGYVVREAFRGADKARLASIPNSWRIGQMVFFAVDVSSHCFAEGNPDMASVFNHCGRLTNYFSGFDEALAVSSVKNLDVSSRVGRVGMPTDKPTHAKAIDVDCGPRYHAIHHRTFHVIDGMVSHSWYLEDEIWLNDLADTLKGGIDRNLISSRSPVPSGLPDDFVLNVQ